MTVAVAAPAPEDDDVLVLDHARCRCGRQADVIVSTDETSTWCSIRCGCGAFSPVVAEESRR